ncbi:HlyD family secretion protein [Synechococcus sp. CCY9201]|uniref:HlyD family secretion protein n=1 Tax=unclassified Synechococcus TaxID=2626047 RepID=UPI002B21F3C2|nr:MULTISPECIES: HlyD family secretion protein [unclassified Synechococcus]MEA5424234.1 HlyD family secretion protein [Synechococcus sp. CCY9202]MEA5473805.1 HlyD family secretion protein [Synechococcus sp. CCY9201]
MSATALNPGEAPGAPAPPPAPPGKRGRGRTLWIAGGAVALVGAGLTGYFVRNHYFPSTNDAYVHAYTVTVSPYVEGYIKTIQAEPNAFVKKGQLLYEIVPLPFQLSVAQQQHQVEAAIAQKSSLEDQLLKARQALKDQQASQWLIDLNQQRYAYLQQQQVVALEKEQEFESAKLEAKAKVKSATIEISRLQKQISEQDANIRAMRAAVGTAKVNLNYTRYYAPMDAYVSNSFSIRAGQYVKPGQAMFKLIDNTHWWVDANFMESQIGRIRDGMPATISLDMYPGTTFSGKVINISQGSGAYDSLLPPQNATGNWVKVPQRFPVRIRLEQNTQHPLRAGATAHATVNTL